VIHLPNGVDPELFRIPADPPEVRQNTRKGRKPLLTYVGVLSERIDLDLIEQIALEWPSCHFQLIGPMSRNVEQRWRKLRRIPNLEWSGLVHHSKVPEILRSSDVLLIPHAESPLSLSMDPLKLYEYLTTGLPIVSTPVPPTQDYASLLYVGTGKQFSEKIGDALEEVSRSEAQELWDARIQESKNHHWDKRIMKVESDLCNILDATV
jgi:glycosyltransferase involved in cell wall biosynthesis